MSFVTHPGMLRSAARDLQGIGAAVAAGHMAARTLGIGAAESYAAAEFASVAAAC